MIECSEQELILCVISIIPIFLAGFVQKMSLTKNKAVQCDLCEFWVHIICSNLIYLDYRYFKNRNESWYCIECCSTIFPFNSLSSNKNFLVCCTSTDNNTTKWIDLGNDHNSSLSLKPSSNLELLINHFNNATSENSNDPEKICSSKYYDIDKMHNIAIPHKNKLLFLFHVNVCSLNKKFGDVQHLLNGAKNVFDVIAISETRITNQAPLLNNLNLINYSFEFTATDTFASGTLLYIANHLSYKCCNDLNIYKKMNWNLLLLKFSTREIQILLWESFTNIHL